jgi:phage baseplate assembly protein W|tara:strand:+ start:322 stop:747 length:426 start_codon:yes stop_codon:yes gene_type:complete
MASALENDLNPNTYVGLSFPLRAGNNQDFAMTKNSLEQARHNLKNLLLTHVGERVGQPLFGSRLRELVFEQIDNDLPIKIEDEVKRAVETWLPYINIKEVNTLTDDGDNNKIFVEIKFSTTINPQTTESITLDSSYTATVV